MASEDYDIKLFKNKQGAIDIYLDDNKDRYLLIIRLSIVVTDGGKENIAIGWGA